MRYLLLLTIAFYSCSAMAASTAHAQLDAINTKLIFFAHQLNEYSGRAALLKELSDTTTPTDRLVHIKKEITTIEASPDFCAGCNILEKLIQLEVTRAIAPWTMSIVQHLEETYRELLAIFTRYSEAKRARTGAASTPSSGNGSDMSLDTPGST